MNPEHHFKKTFYNITLHGDACDKDAEALKTIFEAVSKIAAFEIRDDWQDVLGQTLEIAKWSDLDERTAFTLLAELDTQAIMAVSETFHKVYLFNDNVLVEDLAKRAWRVYEAYSHELDAWVRFKNQENLRRNRHYSGILMDMEEYAFELWAKQENIVEAYRLTILPAFDNAIVSRIYLKDGLVYFVYKVGQRLYSVPKKHGLTMEKHYQLELSHWNELKAFMDGNFWTAETWYSHYYEAEIRDGVMYLFEGWKDCEHKFLDDHSPDEGSIAAQAYQLFRQINIDSF